MVVSLRVLKNEASLEACLGGVFRTLSNVYDEDFLVDLVNVFQPFTIFKEKAPLQLYDIILNMPLIFFSQFLLQYILIV